MFKGELNQRVMSKFVALTSKLYVFLDTDNAEEKKTKGVKKCVIKKVLKFNHYMDALLLNKTIRSTQQRLKSDYHTITTEEINKTSLSRKDDKRIQSFDGIHTYPIRIDNDLFNQLELEIRNKPIQLYHQNE